MNVPDFIFDFKEAFNGEPWMGTSMMSSLESISWEEVNKKPKGIKKSIAEILLHIINWRVFVISKIKENEGFDIELNSEDDWTLITITSEEEWKALLNKLEETQEIICNLIQTKSRYWFRELTAGKQYINEHMTKGVIQHDVYHLGQINLIKSQLNQF